ncbi:hypothetical protein KL86DYS2_10315 [uncultured Dysgonomonas sp.]|uniref:Uncharacterized protein n=1 Tax=uncultured Dysgonomonas sp. TaxID=206096 RepID=A0A212IYC4_9BACT|nr:hypothetical protein KL86DYS2_10315 [uncultured Dysgonomonas sp.]
MPVAPSIVNSFLPCSKQNRTAFVRSLVSCSGILCIISANRIWFSSESESQSPTIASGNLLVFARLLVAPSQHTRYLQLLSIDKAKGLEGKLPFASMTVSVRRFISGRLYFFILKLSYNKRG